jgi:DNA-directed RNA polymerase specialized sigma24 family protein
MVLAPLYGMNKKDKLLEAYGDLKNRGADEDALHDAIVEILPRLEQIGNIAAYFKRLVWQKRSLSTPRTFEYSQPIGNSSPEDEAIRSEAILAVHEEIAKLPPREREVVERHDFNNKKCREIALTRGENASAVRGVLFRARQRLSCSLRAWSRDDECRSLQHHRKKLRTPLTYSRRTSMVNLRRE